MTYSKEEMDFIYDLRHRGFAVFIQSPEDLKGVDHADMENHLTEAADYIIYKLTQGAT